MCELNQEYPLDEYDGYIGSGNNVGPGVHRLEDTDIILYRALVKAIIFTARNPTYH